MLTDFEKSLLEVISHLQTLVKRAILDRDVALKRVAEVSEERDEAVKKYEAYVKANSNLMSQLKEKQGQVAELERRIESKRRR